MRIPSSEDGDAASSFVTVQKIFIDSDFTAVGLTDRSPNVQITPVKTYKSYADK
jgi:hypothetical protein